jgi:hypothetical protein
LPAAGTATTPPPLKGGAQTTPKDYIAAPITMRRGLTGAKPPQFCRWVLDLLGYEEGDMLDDLFPGTAVMASVLAQGTLPTTETRPPAELSRLFEDGAA